MAGSHWRNLLLRGAHGGRHDGVICSREGHMAEGISLIADCLRPLTRIPPPVGICTTVEEPFLFLPRQSCRRVFGVLWRRVGRKCGGGVWGAGILCATTRMRKHGVRKSRREQHRQEMCHLGRRERPPKSRRVYWGIMVPTPPLGNVVMGIMAASSLSVLRC